MEEKVKKVMAWIVPDQLGEVFPVCSEAVTFGYHPRNDVVLKSCLADCVQASIQWREDELYLTSLGYDYQTFLNGEPLKREESRKLYHQDSIVLAGQKYSILRRDGKCAAELIFRSADGSEYLKLKCNPGEPISLPEAPGKAETAAALYVFDHWELVEGSPADSSGRCTGSAVYCPVYQEKRKSFPVEFRAEGGYADRDGTVLIKEFLYGEPIVFPSGEELKKVEGRVFTGWKCADGNSGTDKKCRGSGVYEAVYDSERSTGTVRLDDFVVDCQSGSILPILPSRPFWFGSSSDCDVKAPSLTKRAMQIDGETFLLSYHSRRGVLLNGDPLPENGPVQLYNGDKLQIGEKCYMLVCTRERISAVLQNLSGGELEIQGNETVLGFRYQPEFWKGSRYVSKKHAVITMKDGKYYLRDAGSTNGTYCRNGKLRPGEDILLASGDRINFADVCCQFVIR